MFSFGSTTAQVNGKVITLDVPVQIVGGRLVNGGSLCYNSDASEPDAKLSQRAERT